MEFEVQPHLNVSNNLAAYKIIRVPYSRQMRLPLGVSESPAASSISLTPISNRSTHDLWYPSGSTDPMGSIFGIRRQNIGIQAAPYHSVSVVSKPINAQLVGYRIPPNYSVPEDYLTIREYQNEFGYVVDARSEA